MWLTAWLWVKKGVGMGVGWGRTPFLVLREPGGGVGVVQDAWGFGGDGRTLRVPRLGVQGGVAMGGGQRAGALSRAGGRGWEGSGLGARQEVSVVGGGRAGA